MSPTHLHQSGTERSNGRHRATDDRLVLRNHDGSTEYTVDVELTGADGTVTYEQTFTVAPLATVPVRVSVERGMYDVTVSLTNSGTDSAECLVGPDRHETALVEIGNGIVSVTDGLR